MKIEHYCIILGPVKYILTSEKNKYKVIMHYLRTGGEFSFNFHTLKDANDFLSELLENSLDN